MKPALLIVLSFALLPLLTGCTNYGDSVEFGKSSIYYKDGATKEEAKKLGELLKEVGYLSETEAHDVQLVKEGETYIIKFATKEDAEFTDDILLLFGSLRDQIANQVFPGKSVKIHFTDENLETIKEL